MPAEVISIASGSRVKVDIDNGFTQVSNELIEAISAYDFNGRELRIIMLVIRGSYGYQAAFMNFIRKEMVKVSGIDGPNISRIKKSLLERNILIEEDSLIGVNPYISEWAKSAKSVNNDTKKTNKRCQERHSKVSRTTQNSVRNDTALCQERHKINPSSTTLNKETKNINLNSSDTASPESVIQEIITHPNAIIESKNRKQWGTQIDLDSAKYIFNSVAERTMETNEPNWAAWANDIRLMRESDKRDPQHIATLFNFSNHHGFWSTVILSPASLRKNWGKIAAQYHAEKHSRIDTRTPEERIKDTSWADDL